MMSLRKMIHILKEYHAELLLTWLVLLLISNTMYEAVWVDEYEIYYYYLDFVVSCVAFVARIAFVLWSCVFLQKAVSLWEGHESARAEETAAQSADQSAAPSDASDASAEPVKPAAFDVAALLPAARYVVDAVLMLSLSWVLVAFISQIVNYYPPGIYIEYFYGEFKVFSWGMLVLPAVLCAGSGTLLYLLRGRKDSLILMLEAVFLLSAVLVFTALFCLLTNVDISSVTIWLVILINALFGVNVLCVPIWQFAKAGHTSPFAIRPLFALPKKSKRMNAKKSRPPVSQKQHQANLKSLWSLRFTLQMLPYMVLFAGLVFLVSSCFYTIEPYQQALVYHFGKLEDECVTDPGLHFKLPAPFETVEITDVSRVQSLYIGYEPSGSSNYLWTSEHGGEYTLLLGDGNELVAVNMRLNYSIDDLAAYKTNYEDPEALLSARAYAIIMERTMSSDLDTFLSVDRQTLSAEVAEELNAYSDEMGLGIDVMNVIIESIHPPAEVASVYQNVVNATIEQSTMLSEAEAYADQTVNAAEMESTISVNTATAEQITGVTEAESDAMEFAAACEAYALSPDCYLLVKTTDAFKQVIQNASLYIFTPDTEDEASQYLISNGQNVVTIGSDGE